MDNGDFAVAHNTSTHAQSCVIIYSPAGDPKKRLSAAVVGEIPDVKCFKDEIFVTSLNEVLVFSVPDEKLVRRFGRGEKCNGLAVAQDGHVLVAETHCVSVWSPAGEYIHHWGEFKNPTHLTIMPNGQVAVVDTSRSRIQIF